MWFARQRKPSGPPTTRLSVIVMNKPEVIARLEGLVVQPQAQIVARESIGADFNYSDFHPYGPVQNVGRLNARDIELVKNSVAITIEVPDVSEFFGLSVALEGLPGRVRLSSTGN